MAKIQNNTVDTSAPAVEKPETNKPVEAAPVLKAEPENIVETPKVAPVVTPVPEVNVSSAPVQATPAPATKPVSRVKSSSKPTPKVNSAPKPAPKAKVAAKPVKKTTKSLKKVAKPAKPSVKKAAKPVKPSIKVAKQPESAPAFAYDVVAYGAESVELLVESNTAFLAGFQKLNETLVSLVQSSFEENSKFAKAILEFENIQDAIEYQSKYTQDTLSKSLEEGRKITEMTVKLAEEVSVPFSTQIEKISGKLAA